MTNAATNTTIDKAATLTRSELFGTFLHSTIPGTDSLVSDYFKGFDTPGLDDVLNRIADDCSNERVSSYPANEIEIALNEFQAVTLNLQAALWALHSFENQHRIEGDGGDGEERFRVPTFGDDSPESTLPIYAKLRGVAARLTGQLTTKLNELADEVHASSLADVEVNSYRAGDISREMLVRRLEKLAGGNGGLIEYFRTTSRYSFAWHEDHVDAI